MLKKDDLSKYQKKTDIEHILDNPDTYIGSVELLESDEFIYDNEEKIIKKKNIHYNPGLYKIFDEGIVNCRDHVIRMKQKIKDNKDEENKDEQNQEKDSNSIYPVSYINISIEEDGVITMMNDGNGIDIEKHPEYKVWIPELIFTQLRTSTNYNKDEKKIVGGKNGFGFKLALIWSTWGYIETVDHIRGLKYTQEVKNNLSIIEKPNITKCNKSKPYTKLSFLPDYKRMYLFDKITPDIYSLLQRRVYDIAAVTEKNVKVKFNSKEINIKNFNQYVNIINKDNEYKYEEANERWEYAVSLSNTGEFYQVSFVNGIYTSKGGKHIEYILNQIIKKLTLYIKQKKKVDVKPTSIKEQLALFVRCDIENPSFDSQTKDYMNTPISKFGSSCEVSDKFIEKIAKMGVMNSACEISEIKENKQQKKTDGTKSKSVRGIPKLIDANYAGTNKSYLCSLILCEGDSAKSGIVSGLNKDDRNIIGVYPMKGKILNIRGESISKLGENKEITEIKQILGLEHNKIYQENDVKNKLRYGKIIFMTDQDLDGSHIKGLCINVFDTAWPSLIKIPNFISFINTPIIKAEKGKEIKQFYNDGEYELWKQTVNTNLWKIKYYKGLGTSTSKEFKEYFENKKIVHFKWTDEKSSEELDKIFNKKRSDDRKEWLINYDKNLYLDTNKEEVTYEEFINKEFIHFSIADNERSIPGPDGLKTSLRKILYSAFKKGLTHEKGKEIKVAQFSGYVSENSGYHHGEASLNAGIIGMAQDFLGSNNLNLFMPNGQFGTRRKGGKDAGSERYIFTQLNILTRKIFRKEDDPILDYLNDDGLLVEPQFYVPIVPMILINGSKGIGTGFSTEILSYNIIEIIEILENKLNNKEDIINYEINPYYKNFEGTIENLNINKENKINSNAVQKYLVKGCYKVIKENKIQITELPIGTWTEDYKCFLESLLDNKTKEKLLIKDYIETCTDVTIDFIIEFYPGVLNELINKYDDDKSLNELEKYLKLYTLISNSNMHIFNSKQILTKYNNIKDIINEYYELRLLYYSKRKEYLINILKNDLIIIRNQCKFITMNLNDEIDLRKKNNKEINSILKLNNFDSYPEICKSKPIGSESNGSESNPSENNGSESEDSEDYKYLIKMPMDSVSEENVKKLLNNKKNKEEELENLLKITNKEIWLKELNELKDEYLKNINQPNMQIKLKKNKK